MIRKKLSRCILLLACITLISFNIQAQSFEVKKIEFDKKETSTWGYGEIDRYWVTFKDGTTGYICYSSKYQVWYIYNGSGNTWEYQKREKAIKALYIYKNNDGEISEDGRVKR